MIRFLTIILVASILLAPRIADACGVWHMQDVEKQLDIEWLINAGSIKNAKTKARVAALYLDSEKRGGLPRVVANGKVIFDYTEGAKIRKYGKPVASLDGDKLTIGKQTFTFDYVDAGNWHGLPSWKVTVKVNDKVVVESAQASALCAAAAKLDMVIPDQKFEIRLRMSYYLVWRQLGV